MGFSEVQEAIDAIGRLGMAVVVDDEDRENEGDLVMAAEAATPENIAFFLAHTSGVICVPLLPERADALELPLMVTANTEAQRTAFTVSVDYRHGTTTGISAATGRDHQRPDRSRHPAHRPQPSGAHLPAALPHRWRAQAGRPHRGHVDLCRAAGLSPAGVLCEIVTEDKSEMARLPELERFAKKHDLPLISIADLIRYRRPTRSWSAWSPRPASPRRAASSGPTSTNRCWTGSSTWPSSWARSPATRTCWCGCTPNA